MQQGTDRIRNYKKKKTNKNQRTALRFKVINQLRSLTIRKSLSLDLQISLHDNCQGRTTMWGGGEEETNHVGGASLVNLIVIWTNCFWANRPQINDLSSQ